MRILITNDDGIHAEGIEVLERVARNLLMMFGLLHHNLTKVV